jgi:predicted GNAT family N-acyltransferase
LRRQKESGLETEIDNRDAQVSVRVATDPKDLDAVYAIRFEVFVGEQGVPAWEELDVHDETALHVLAEAAGVACGTARLVSLPEGTGKVGRVAVLPPYRGAGVGTAIMRFLMDAAFPKQRELVLEAQVEAIRFYERLGFQCYEDRFWDCGIEHQRMRLAAPALDSPTRPGA